MKLITYFLLCILLVSVSEATEKSKTTYTGPIFSTTQTPDPCGWTGTLKEDGKCSVTIVAPPDYDGFSCKTKPRKTGGSYTVECTWTPKVPARE
jgi:hypothetical protein